MGFVISGSVLKKYEQEPGVFHAAVPEGITKIEDFAFKECRDLMTVTLPQSLTELGRWAFCSCSALERIELPQGITELGDGTFDACRSLSQVTLPSGLKRIGDYAFHGCKSLAAVSLPEELESIGFRAFRNSGLTEIVLPAGVTEVGGSAFSSCRLQRILIPGSVKNVDGSAFSLACDLREMTCPADLLNQLRKIDFLGLKRLHTDCPVKLTDRNVRALAAATLLEDLGDPTNAMGCPEIAYSAMDLLSTAAEYPAVLRVLTERKKITAENFDAFLSAAQDLERMELTAELLKYREENHFAGAAETAEEQIGQALEVFDLSLEDFSLDF